MDKSELLHMQNLAAGVCKSVIQQSWVIFDMTSKDRGDIEHAWEIMLSRAESAKRSIDELVEWIGDQLWDDDEEEEDAA